LHVAVGLSGWFPSLFFVSDPLGGVLGKTPRRALKPWTFISLQRL